MTLVAIAFLEGFLYLVPVMATHGLAGLMAFALILAAIGVMMAGIYDYNRDRWLHSLFWALGVIWYFGRLSHTVQAATGAHTDDLGVAWVILSALLMLFIPLTLVLMPLMSALRGRG